MRRKPFAFVLAALLVVIALLLAKHSADAPRKLARETAASTRPNQSAPAAIQQPVVPSPQVLTPDNTSAAAVSGGKVQAPPAAAEFAEPADAQAMLEADKVNLMIRDYRSLFGQNPVGTNAEIMAAVAGKNAKQAKLGPPEGMQLNEKGELIDRWGTPYFFHQISRDHMEIRSAGADRVLWTEDDAVVR